ncbi:MAG: hypothetical protein ABI678_00825 [Kofleriaceae bacterium]
MSPLDREYLWDRLPLMAPMALAIARRRDGARDVALRITALVALLVEHLGKEEQLLAGDDPASATTWVERGMVGEHLMIAIALDEVVDAVASWTGPISQLERWLGDELQVLAEQIHAEIAREETQMARRLQTSYRAKNAREPQRVLTW